MFNTLFDLVARVRGASRREDGQALAEYGLLLALIAVVCVLAITALGVAIAGTLGNITGSL